ADWLIDESSTAVDASPKADIYVHIDFETLATLRDRPARLSGHGPVPAEIARQIAHKPTSTWRRVLTDASNGTPVEVSSTRYPPPAAVADYVRVGDSQRRFPGCHRPPEFSDLDRLPPYSCGGASSPTRPTARPWKGAAPAPGRLRLSPPTCGSAPPSAA